MKYDWHGYEAKLRTREKQIRNSKISEKNKKLIFEFQKNLVITGISKPRILKYLEILRLSAVIFKKNFDKVTKKDIMNFVSIIEQRNYSEWTKHSYKVIVKKFFQWLRKCEDKEYPPEVKWIHARVKKDRQNLPNEGDLLTEKDIQKLLDTANNLRDRAFISCLWESGCRIGEIASIRIKDIVFDEYGCVIHVNGKTGPRKIRVINSAPYLANWLGTHPNNTDRNDFVWVTHRGQNKGKLLMYSTIRKLIIDLCKEAGIKKRCNPHIFRHSRATFLANHLTEFQMNSYFGWVQGSDMPSTYVHLSGKDTDSALLKLNGVVREKEHDQTLLTPQKCPRCEIINSHESKFCNKCGAVLDVKEAMVMEENQKQFRTKRDRMDLVMNMMMKDPEVVEVIRKKMEKMANPEIEI
ncbi:tyrosine-type recombinase/integrase [Candidatus Woesearchaeota archaeon]|nr:tyrosine-type recombinase/integrase [Candidatus Woesearchaeota archaeon]MBW3005622.1 tyrosine-type recombinase/integrase [Candidatus Woesearchaeota archaeon]